ncbi:MAG: hypothetical protein KAT00_04555, partial [Planctomycetes bacterium]|nr:hypothetical protein [Planctomycetota bacterium]
MKRIKKITIVLLISVLLPAYAFGGDVYVATDGSDSDKGRIDSPFRTIEKAVSELDPGETCYIRGGTYHEEVVINNLDGTSSSPITFTNYNGEEVIIDGTEPVSSGWTVHSGNIYKTTLSEDVWQLFVNGEQMIPAR